MKPREPVAPSKTEHQESAGDTIQDTLRRCQVQLPGNLHSDDEPSFAEPWQAQAFALAVHLIDSGRISWSRWSATLGEEIANVANTGFRDDGSDYYLLWLRALERLVSDNALVPPGEVEKLAEDWKQAYLHTPHGRPVVLP